MLTTSAKTRSGSKAPIRATTLPVKIVAFHGVRKRGCTEPKKLAW